MSIVNILIIPRQELHSLCMSLIRLASLTIWETILWSIELPPSTPIPFSMHKFSIGKSQLILYMISKYPSHKQTQWNPFQTIMIEINILYYFYSSLLLLQDLYIFYSPHPLDYPMYPLLYSQLPLYYLKTLNDYSKPKYNLF